MTDKNRSIVAIANNHISGREIGAPLTNVALKILMDKSYGNAGLPPALLRPLCRGWNGCATSAMLVEARRASWSSMPCDIKL